MAAIIAMAGRPDQRPLISAMRVIAPDEEWPMDDAVQGLRCDPIQRPRRDHCAECSSLHPVWTFSTGVLGGHEANHW